MDFTPWAKGRPVAQPCSKAHVYRLPGHAASPHSQPHHILTSRRLLTHFTVAALPASQDHHLPPSCISNILIIPRSTRNTPTFSYPSPHHHILRPAIRFSKLLCAAHTSTSATTAASAAPTPTPGSSPPHDNDRTTPSPPPPTTTTPSSNLGTASPSTTRYDNPDSGAASSSGSLATMSLDWNDWIISDSSDGGEGSLVQSEGGITNSTSAAALGRDGAAGDGSSSGEAPDGDAIASGGANWRNSAAATTTTGNSTTGTTSTCAGGPAITTRVALYAVAASFDRRQLEGRLKAVYGVAAVRKFPDVILCQLSRGAGKQPGADLFFFDYGVVAAWGLSPEAERDVVRNLARECAVQPLPDRDQERDVFRCSYASNLADAANGVGAGSTISVIQPTPAPATYLDGDGSTGGTTSTRRLTRRAERISGGAAVVAAAVGAPLAASGSAPPPSRPPAAAATPAVPAAESPTESRPLPAGPYSVLSFPPQIADDTVLLHVRHIGDTATQLAVSYGLAQSTKLSAFEQAVEAIVEETRSLPEALAEEGEVHLSAREIGRLIGKVFVLKRSVNLLGSVTDTPEFFWYAPDQLQTLYNRIAEYVELGPRVEQLNNRFSVLQEMLELIRAQEEARHGNRLEWIVIWLIVVEVVLGVFELLELFGVIGPGGGF